MNISFTDNSTHEDISKVLNFFHSTSHLLKYHYQMIVYATHNILTEADCPLGYLLLRCVRLYLELDMYASLEVHTTETISSGRHTHLAFAALLRVCLIYYLLLPIGN